MNNDNKNRWAKRTSVKSVAIRKIRVALLNSNAGFTLLEVLIYSLILSIFMGAAFAFMGSILGATDTLLERNEVIVNQEFIERKLNRFAPFATAIVTPGANSSSTEELRLNVSNAALNPVIFSLNEGAINLSVGGEPSVPLTNNRVNISSFLAEHFDNSSSPPILRVYFEVKSNIYQHIVSTTTLNYVLP
jgi:prepilin-type N-terminal cleavage/methylation domain-containing protein